MQKFSYALFLMDDAAMRKLQTSAGWELGTTPNIVVVDRGAAATLSTTTVNRGIYAIFFHQRGLMGGLALQGTKITRINPNG